MKKRLLYSIASTLSEFQPISLQEMDEVALANRIDTKFTLNSELIPALLNKRMDDYYILEVSGKSHTVTLNRGVCYKSNKNKTILYEE